MRFKQPIVTLRFVSPIAFGKGQAPEADTKKLLGFTARHVANDDGIDQIGGSH
jgi:hypothetical protein